MQWDRQKIQLFEIERVCIQTEICDNFTYSFMCQSFNDHDLSNSI